MNVDAAFGIDFTTSEDQVQRGLEWVFTCRAPVDVSSGRFPERGSLGRDRPARNELCDGFCGAVRIDGDDGRVAGRCRNGALRFQTHIAPLLCGVHAIDVPGQRHRGQNAAHQAATEPHQPASSADPGTAPPLEMLWPPSG